ncbi:MAG: efflux transporter outer membrane subunit [Gammaproteobacteria bacterium]|nr:efflux transporter outer membrane subunit [Gammaproteobacteria bacterium]MBU1490242.1 efflux transporter outer membrane subunit [Gammaproteobacteria bacterium]MBU2065388.1 efflux transporter outer membrane subunit [Gammaproteobacteria bacterium]MBU2139129.1 efflux transporter outer membrane subunit [Gammaproteobacteria bacterium]MBU2215481.1 efflux transporter outer membrane subunit [Gammaproteobacteria bacterium]
MRRPLYRRASLTLMAVLGLAGCASQEPAHEALVTPSATTPSALAALSPRWWESFEDQSFERLIGLALRDNLDLLSATERVREQRAQRSQAAAALLPDLAISGNYGRNRNALDGRTNEHFYGLDLAWELDVSGRLRALRNASDAELRAAAEDYRSLRIGLMAEVANTYLRYRLAQQQLAIAIRASATQRETARVTRERFAQGTVNRLDVERIEAQVQVTEAEIPVARQQQVDARYALAYLLAAEQQAVDAILAQGAETLRQPSQDALAALLEVPVEILRERPDVRAASERLQAAGEELAASRAARYPQLTLGALGGFERGASAPAWSLTAGLLQPLFDFGRIRAGIEASDARRAQAFLAYETSLRQALRETQSAIHAYGQGWQRQQRLEQATAAATRAVELARNQYEVGTVSLLEVLDAERSLFDIQRSQVQASTDVSLRWVELHRTMGIAPQAVTDALASRE